MSASAHTFSHRGTAHLPFAWPLRRRARTPKLDVAALPDHLKRDLGFLTGRDPSPRNIYRD
jgi:hypothetical protein